MKSDTISISKTKLKIVGVALLMIATGVISAACSSSSQQSTIQKTTSSNPQTAGQALTQLVYDSLAKNPKTSYPWQQLQAFSDEESNLKERLLRYNDPAKISYVYELSSLGTVINYFTIEGKVSSTQSQMTATDWVQGKTGNCGSSYGCINAVVAAPGDDGSYGEEEPGIFFFTTDGVLVTWNGLYQESDAPMHIDGNGHLVYIIGSKPSSTAGIVGPAK